MQTILHNGKHFSTVNVKIEDIGLAKKFVRVLLCHLIEKLE